MRSLAITLLFALGLSQPGLADDPQPKSPSANANANADADAAIAKLVGDLGAPDYQLREQATAELEKHGVAALPALRQAAKSNDPEISDRASELLRKIAAANPQAAFAPQVALDYPEASLEDVIKGIASQSGVKIELTGNSGKIVTLREPRPLPFWQAIDRVCAVGDLTISTDSANANPFVLRQNFNNNPFGGGGIGGGIGVGEKNEDGQNPLVLSPGKPVAYPSFYDGFHCVRLHRIHEFLNRNATLSFGADADAVNQAQENRSRTLELAVLTKPSAGPAPIVELASLKIIDDQDRELSHDPNANANLNLNPGGALNADILMRNRMLAMNARMRGINMRAAPFGASMCSVALRNVDPPSKRIKLAQGTVKVISFQETKPTVIELENALGKAIETPEVTVRIDAVDTDAKQAITKIKGKVTFKNQDAKPLGIPNAGFPDNFQPFLNANAEQIQFADKGGQMIRPFSSTMRSDGRGFSGEWQFRSNLQGPPKTMMVRSANRQETNVAFEFRDVPMPQIKDR